MFKVYRSLVHLFEMYGSSGCMNYEPSGCMNFRDFTEAVLLFHIHKEHDIFMFWIPNKLLRKLTVEQKTLARLPCRVLTV